MKVTLKDIAREAEVSLTTASYVLNECGNVSDGVRKKVLAIMSKHGYQPRKRRKAPASRVKGLKYRQIAFVLPYEPRGYRSRVGGEYFDSILAGLEEVLASCSVDLMVTKLEEDGSLPERVRDQAVDGLILAGPTDRSAPVPAVHFASPFYSTEIDVVMSDHESCGRLAADVLLEAGCSSCVFLNPLSHHTGFVLRKEGFFKRLAGDDVEGATIEMCGLDDPGVSAAMVSELAKQYPKADGIFIPGSDVNVTAIAIELQRQGVDSIKTVAAICNEEVLVPLNLGFRYVDVQIREMARTAAEVLLWRIQNPDAALRKVMVQPRLLK